MFRSLPLPRLDAGGGRTRSDAQSLPRLDAGGGRTRSDAQNLPQRVAVLVGLTTRLADRMEARPSAGPERDHDRQERVALLRRTAQAGTRTLEVWQTDGSTQPRCPLCRRPG